MFPKLEEKRNDITNKPEIVSENAMFSEMLKNIRKKHLGEEIDPLWIDVYNWYEKNSKWNEKLKKAMRRIRIYKQSK